MESTGSVIVSWDFSHGKDVGILVIGEKTLGETVKIVNAFQGQEAYDIRQKLITKKGK